jgi:hypothetical protein
VLVIERSPVIRGDVVRTAPSVEEIGVERVEVEVNCGLRGLFDFSAGECEQLLVRYPKGSQPGWGFPSQRANSGFSPASGGIAVSFQSKLLCYAG